MPSPPSAPKAKAKAAAKPKAAKASSGVKQVSKYIKLKPKGRTNPKSRKLSALPAKVRPSLTAGTVVIMLAGHFRGKRAVMLGSTKSGCIVVTGPYSVNGVPVRRVNPRYVIATSTKIAVTGIDASKFGDDYFKREKEAPKKKGEDAFMGQGAGAKKTIDPKRIADQKKVDATIVAGLKKDKVLLSYMKAKFSLTNETKPHAMKF